MFRNRSWKKPDSLTIVFAVLGVLILFFIFVPLIKTMTSSSPGTLWDTLRDQSVYLSILVTIWAGLLATLVGLILGIPLAYLPGTAAVPGKEDSGGTD